MTDLASLSVEIVTKTGDSAQQLEAVQKSADSAAKSVDNLATANKQSVPATEQAAQSFSRSTTVIGTFWDAVNKGSGGFTGITADMARFASGAYQTEAATAKAVTAVAAIAPAAHAASEGLKLMSGTTTRTVGDLLDAATGTQGYVLRLRSLNATIEAATHLLPSFATSLGLSGAAGVAAVTAVVGLTAAFAVLVINGLLVQKKMQDVKDSVDDMAKGVARGTGAVGSDFVKQTADVAKSLNLTRSHVADLGQEFVKSGSTIGGQYGRWVTLSAQFAKATGTDVDAAAKSLAKATGDIGKGIDGLNSQLRIFSNSEVATIKSLADQGRSMEANQAVAARLEARFKDISAAEDGFRARLAQLKNVFDDASVGVLRFVTNIARIITGLAQLIAHTAPVQAAINLITHALQEFGQIITSVLSLIDGAVSKFADYIDKINGTKTAQDELNTSTQAFQGLADQDAKHLDDVQQAADKAAQAKLDLAKATEEANRQEKIAADNEQADAAAMDKEREKITESTKDKGDAAKATKDLAEADKKAKDQSDGFAQSLDDQAKAANDAANADDRAAKAAGEYGNAAQSASGQANPLEGNGQVTLDLSSLSWASRENTAALNSNTSSQQTLISSLQAQAANLQSIISAAKSATKPTAPAEDTTTTAPSAYGSDKNASSFYDPNTRQQFLGQFGIKGNEQTQAAERQYALDLKAYEDSQKAAARAEAQLKNLNFWMAYIAAHMGAGGNAPFAAEGGDFIVGGSAGRDQNRVSLNVTKGELVSVRTPDQIGKGSGSPIHVHMNITTPDAGSFKKSRSTLVNHTSSLIAAAVRNRGVA